MSLTLYILCTLPMLVMLAIAFVNPRTGDSGDPYDVAPGEPTRTAPAAGPASDRSKAPTPEPVADPVSDTTSDQPERVPVGNAP